MPPERLETKQGFELQMGVNHISHALLTELLMPSIIAEQGSRVIYVSSAAHAGGTEDFIRSEKFERAEYAQLG